jgi:sugar/nucleoside kinase (ribokinase family)
MKKVLGIGNALVDILITLENDQKLPLLNLPKGSMQLVDKDRSNAILDSLKEYSRIEAAGGSAANTIHGLAKLGVPAGYIGMIGKDELGGFFVRDMIDAGVEPSMIHCVELTGRATTLVTPDSERTFATYLGAAIELSAGHIDDLSSVFRKYDILHLEGYLVQNHELIEKALVEAKKNNLLVSLDLASYNVVEANMDFLERMIDKYVDIVFANEEEAKSFTGEDPGKALTSISKACKIAVVKTGKKGSLIHAGNEIIEIGIIPVTPLDTTGAGDLYASGFLYGIANDLPLKRCGEIGALLAGNVVEVMGAKMPAERWINILNTVTGDGVTK